MDPRRSLVPDLKPSISGLDLLNSIRRHPPFETGHSRLDHCLWNGSIKQSSPSFASTQAVPPKLFGLSRRQHLQIEGPPGAGKTKLALGLAIRGRAASVSYGDERLDNVVEVLFIDADGSVNSQLIMRSVRSLIQSEYSDSSVPNLIDKILSGVHLVRITSSAELGFFFKNLPRWLERNNKVKLIVLDSITAHTRYVSMSINDRSIIASIVRDGLMIASSRYSCAIVVTTQLTTKLSGRGAILITPDFQSNAWSTTKMWRTVLAYNQDGSRRAVVAVNDRSNQLFKFEPITFEIDSIGIYDPESLIQNTQNTN